MMFSRGRNSEVEFAYFVWDRDYDGDVPHFNTIWDGEPTGPGRRKVLDEYDVLIRRNEALSILEKVIKVEDRRGLWIGQRF